MSTTSKHTSKAANFIPLLSSMSKDELKAVATSLNVPHGKSNKAAIANLAKAIDEDKAHVKVVFTISYKAADGTEGRRTYFGKTFRSYVSGPGSGDETWLSPVSAPPVSGSPGDPTTDAPAETSTTGEATTENTQA